MSITRSALSMLAPVTLTALLLCSCAPGAAPPEDADEMADVQGEEAELSSGARPAGWGLETHSNSVDPDYDVVFPQDAVNRIDITISPENWQIMLDDLTDLYGPAGTGHAAPGGPGMESDTNPIWVPVTVAFEGDTWTNVGLRFKGNSSLKSTWAAGILKLPMKLDFDQFEDDYPEIDDQRFYGFKRLVLSSNFHDDSLIREKVTADIYRAASIPAAQTAFYRVYVDYGEGPIYFGLYTMLESVDDTVIETQFEDDSGNLYKPAGTGANLAYGSFDPDTFDKETNADAADWSDILALYDALHALERTTDPAAWRSGLETVLDVDGFLRWLATNTVIQNWDSYGRTPHNYYLYNDPSDGLLTWIPWDNNEALNKGKQQGNLSLPLDEVTAEWPLIRFLMDDPVYHARYVAYVEETASGAFEPTEMAATYTRLHALIEPYVTGADGEIAGYTLLTSPGAFDTQLDYLIQHARTRYNDAMAYVASQR